MYMIPIMMFISYQASRVCFCVHCSPALHTSREVRRRWRSPQGLSGFTGSSLSARTRHRRMLKTTCVACHGGCPTMCARASCLQKEFRAYNILLPHHYLIVAGRCYRAMLANDFKVGS
jgi:hypothetical protein